MRRIALGSAIVVAGQVGRAVEADERSVSGPQPGLTARADCKLNTVAHRETLEW